MAPSHLSVREMREDEKPLVLEMLKAGVKDTENRVALHALTRPPALLLLAAASSGLRFVLASFALALLLPVFLAVAAMKLGLRARWGSLPPPGGLGGPWVAVRGSGDVCGVLALAPGSGAGDGARVSAGLGRRVRGPGPGPRLRCRGRGPGHPPLGVPLAPPPRRRQAPAGLCRGPGASLGRRHGGAPGTPRGPGGRGGVGCGRAAGGLWLPGRGELGLHGLHAGAGVQQGTVTPAPEGGQAALSEHLLCAGTSTPSLPEPPPTQGPAAEAAEGKRPCHSLTPIPSV